MYTNNLIQRFMEETGKYFTNSQRVIDFWIITAAEILRSVVIEDNLTIYGMPPV